MGDQIRYPLPVRDPAAGGRRAGTGLAADLTVTAVVAAFIAMVAGVGWWILGSGHDLLMGFPPLLASWSPHLGPGTAVAAAVAALVVARGARVAGSLAWRPLLWLAWAVSLAWTFGLALIDGWDTGVAGRLTTTSEYLHDVPAVDDIGQLLRTFSEHILTDQPVFWTTHVGAHPPGAFLVFVVLDRVGLGGGGAAGAAVIAVGSSAAVAVAVTLRALGAEALARSALPFLVLFPGAIWIGVSADGLFAAVLAWGTALVAVATTGRGGRFDLVAVAGGALLGYTMYLSYGLVLGMLVPVVVVAGTRRWRVGALASIGAAGVGLAFTLAGFWWLTGYHDLRIVYAASAARQRPYGYFVFANLAAFAVATGPAVWAGLRRLAWAVAGAGRSQMVSRPPRRGPLRPPSHLAEPDPGRGWPPTPAVALLAAALLAVAVADLSGLSKAEVERIWLPFGVWLPVACGLLPRRYVPGWLAAQAGLALAVNSLLLTVW